MFVLLEIHDPLLYIEHIAKTDDIYIYFRIDQCAFTTYCPWNNDGITPSMVVPSIFDSNLSSN